MQTVILLSCCTWRYHSSIRRWLRFWSYYGNGTRKCCIFRITLCATSVSISVQTLRDLGKMKTRESTTMLGAAVFDDILVVILLAFAMSFLGTDDVNLTMIILKKVVFSLLLF